MWSLWIPRVRLERENRMILLLLLLLLLLWILVSFCSKHNERNVSMIFIQNVKNFLISLYKQKFWMCKSYFAEIILVRWLQFKIMMEGQWEWDIIIWIFVINVMNLENYMQIWLTTRIYIHRSFSSHLTIIFTIIVHSQHIESLDLGNNDAKTNKNHRVSENARS